MRLALAAMLAVVAGCGIRQVDPCSGISGTCLALQVDGAVGKIDQARVHVTADGIDSSTTSTESGRAVALPLAIAVVFDTVAGGSQIEATLEVVGSVGGGVVGSGSTSAMIVGGRHTTARVTLTPQGTPGDGDLGTGSDLSAIMPDGGCTPMSTYCEDSTTLRTCRTDGTAYDAAVCQLGCSMATPAHCEGVYPTAPVTNGDLTTAGLTAITFATTTLHGDSGAIDGVRAANGDPAQLEVNNGIGYHKAGGLGIFVFAAATIPAGVTVHLAGPNPIALVSEQDLAIAGILDAQGPCTAGIAVAGGSPGAMPVSGGLDTNGAAGAGQGAGGAGQAQGMSNCGGGGGGGAGHGDVGGKGGNGGCFTVAPGGVAGAAYDTAALTTMRGGSGGGSGGAGSNAGAGGSGGGAIQVVANGTITIGGGASVGGVNVSGCGGGAAASSGGNGGGGSGGAVLLEAPTIHIAANGVVAANGGGGGGGSSSGVAGTNGALDGVRAAGGGSGTSAGGRGGAAGSPTGESGVDATSNGQGTGGGGGSVGRIRINSVGASASVDSGGTLSPALADQAGGSALCSQGALDIH